MEIKKILKENYLHLLCIILIIIIVSSMFGVNGAIVILGILFLIFTPIYLIVRNLDLEQDEKIFFSFFTGVGIFPFVVYVIYYIVRSLRISITISFILLIAIGLGLSHFKNKRK